MSSEAASATVTKYDHSGRVFMMNPESHLPFLLISASSDPDTTCSPFYLTEEVTCLGRPRAREHGSGFIDLELIAENKWVSREHAQIIRDGPKYVLKNWKGLWNIRMYEQELKPGDVRTLRHGDIFQLPNVEEYFKIMFLINDDETVRPPLYIHHDERKVSVFGQDIRFTVAEYKILYHLYCNTDRICRRDEIASKIWTEYEDLDAEQQQEIKKSLEVHLAKIRAKLRAASGGFTFMQTIRHEGLRLVAGLPTRTRCLNSDT